MFSDRHHTHKFESLELFVEDEFSLLKLLLLINIGIRRINNETLRVVVESKSSVVVNTSVCVRQHGWRKLELRQYFDDVARSKTCDDQRKV